MSLEIKLAPVPQRILVLRFSSLGDVVLTSFLIRRLRVRFRKAHIAALTREEFAEILKAVPGLDEVIPWPKKMLKRRDVLKKLRSPQFDTIIDLQNNFRSRRLTAILRPARLLRFHRSRWNRWQRIHLPFRRASLKTPLPIAQATSRRFRF